MNRKSLIGVTVALALAGGVGPAAAADVGDGQLGCNTHEICFSLVAAEELDQHA